MISKSRNFVEEFIASYKAAVKANLTREELSSLLEIKPDSLLRRRLAIYKETGLNLPVLPSREFNGEITQEKLEKYNSYLQDQKPNEIAPVDFSGKQIYVISCAQNATPIHEGFFNSIMTYCNARDAQFVVIPNRYKNPTSIWSQNNENDEWWDNKLKPYLLHAELRIAKSLRVLGNVKIQPTAVTPLSGFDSYTGADSAIFGHPKIQLKTVATPSKMLPKLLTTTGSITIRNYTDSKAGWKGDFHHNLSAVVVEIEKDGTFHLRHIHADEVTGSFYDLDKYYTPNGVEENQRIEALITGDSHIMFMDKKVFEATYSDENSIVSSLQPKYIVFHDLFDMYSRNHHHKNNDIIKVGKHRYGRDNVEEELQITADFIDDVSRLNAINVVVKSNHDEAFDRWLREAEPKDDPENAQFYHYMKWKQYEHIRKTDTGFESIDPFEFWCHNPANGKGLLNKNKTKFLKRGESFQINSVELGFHGDIGINGARGSASQYARIGSKTIIGHSHSPCIHEGCYQVGVSARLDLEYQRGAPSSWLHTHAILYPDGKRTLVNIINGKWHYA